MHHFIYPSQDTFITNNTDSDTLNYGLDEILKVGTEVDTVANVYPTSDFLYSTQSVSNWCVTLFSGHIDSGSLAGTSSFMTGSSTESASISRSYFTGSLTNFFGNVTDFSGRISGIVTGTNTVLISHEVITSSIISNRALLQFDISAISTSIASGDITNPQFTLKLKVARAETLPIAYSLYAYAVGESWIMGDGYVSDGGSEKGASWLYRDYYPGTAWNGPGGSVVGSPASQSFNYEVGDVSMNVTALVNSWLDKTVVNNGIVVMSSDENQLSSSGMTLYFFSNDSNTIYRPVLDVGWDDSTFSTSEAFVSSSGVVISTLPPGLVGVVGNGAQISGSSISGSFSGIGSITVDVNNSASGVIDVLANLSSITGSITIYGSIVGSVSQSVVIVYTPCICPSNTFTTASVSQSLLTGILTSGNFSGSVFTASWDGYNLTNGSITGSWNSSQISGSIIRSTSFISWPTIIVARLEGPFLSGNMLGGVINTNSSSYGIFQGTLLSDFTEIVSTVYLPFTGSIYLSSSNYTSSITSVTNSLGPVDFDKPFVAIIQNLKPTLRAGNIVRVNVFGREEFPLKNFARSTQFSQFLTPKYLPASTYYAIKDNQTEEIVVDFDNYTKVSCDINGNYFLLDTTGLPQERYFKLLIKTEKSGSIYTIDNGDIFKIVR